jgi:hypothetical protein
MSIETANLLDLPLEVRAEKAMKEAVEKVIEEHVRLGLPIHVWQDGAVVEISAERLRAERASG